MNGFQSVLYDSSSVCYQSLFWILMFIQGYHDTDIGSGLEALYLCFCSWQVTKVVVEAEAVMMNGAVQGMCGTAGLALAACTHDTPFIVLCHTYKFSNNDLTDSLVVNELGEYLFCFHSGGKKWVILSRFLEFVDLWCWN